MVYLALPDKTHTGYLKCPFHIQSCSSFRRMPRHIFRIIHRDFLIFFFSRFFIIYVPSRLLLYQSAFSVRALILINVRRKNAAFFFSMDFLYSFSHLNPDAQIHEIHSLTSFTVSQLAKRWGKCSHKLLLLPECSFTRAMLAAADAMAVLYFSCLSYFSEKENENRNKCFIFHRQLESGATLKMNFTRISKIHFHLSDY